MDKKYEAFFDKLAEVSMSISSNMSSTKSDPMIAAGKSQPLKSPSPVKTKMPSLHQYTGFRNPGGSIQFSSNRSMM